MKASFIVAFNMAPSEYDNLTLGERDAIAREANRQRRRR